MYSTLTKQEIDFFSIIPQKVVPHTHYTFSEKEFGQLKKFFLDISEDPEMSLAEKELFWEKAIVFLRSQLYGEWSRELLNMDMCPQAVQMKF